MTAIRTFFLAIEDRNSQELTIETPVLLKNSLNAKDVSINRGRHEWFTGLDVGRVADKFDEKRTDIIQLALSPIGIVAPQ